MAKNFCTYIPSKGKDLHRQLRNKFGYEVGTKAFLRFGINPSFINDNRNTLKLDAEGVPTLTSLLSISLVRESIGKQRMIEMLGDQYSPVEDTIENYRELLTDAQVFNTQNEYRDNYIAVVENVDDGNLSVVIKEKNEATIREFNDQYSAHMLNERLASIFKPLGVTVGKLTQLEQNAGRTGVTDFEKAVDTANGFGSIIRIANNMEGAQALSEEFSHLIVGLFINDPLVKRSINMLANRHDVLEEVLGEDYADTMDFYSDRDNQMELVAEEALGHILQKNLLSDSTNKLPAPSLFKRFINFIKSKFLGYDPKTIQDAIIEVDNSMGELAKSILNGTRQISQDDIINSRRNVQMNALSERIERNIEILKNAAKVETKRYKISPDSKASQTEALVSSILDYTKDDADTTLGLLYYAKTALGELMGLEAAFTSIDSMSMNQKFNFLRSVKMYTDSYGGFIQAVQDAIIDESSEADNMFAEDIEVEGQVVSLKGVIKELNDLNTNLKRRFVRTATPAFVEFLKPFLGKDIIIPFGKNAGQKISVEDLMKKAGSDISFLDRWLDSMADSSDTLLQLFDAAVKAAKDEARIETINNIQAIQRFREKTEKMGITDFEWMFETTDDGKKTGNYISETNVGQFEKDMKDLEQRLDEKYGKNPKGEDAKAKIAERNAWYEENAISLFGSPVPNPTKYRNRDFDNLSANQKEVLREFMEFKKRYDNKLPENRVSLNKAIQIRKDRSQRMWESMTSPSAILNNIKESVANSFLEREDDDQIFGDSRIARGLTNFDGTEFMSLPVLYTNRLRNPEELSTDVFGALMAYAYMANNYAQMDKIISPLEVGRTLATDPKARKVQQTRGGDPVTERVRALGVEAINKVFLSQSNITDKLNDFFESQVYQRYFKDEGTFEVLGKQVNINKLTSWILSSSSLAQLGFNWLANIANVTTGVGMQNIEAAAGEYFNAKELAKADAAYGAAMVSFTKELGSRTKTNKLSLFDELFNIRQDYSKKVKNNSQRKNWMKRLFGAEVAFMGQDAGDHWLYNRTAIAMAMRKQVLLNGKQMSLWDALEVRRKFKDSDVRELNYTDITELDGTKLNTAKFSRQVAHVNQSLFGIYNDEDSNAANRVAAGRLLQQYRKWMKAQFNKRFMGAQYNVTMEQMEEGYYRTFGRLMNQVMRGHVQYSALKDQLTDHEKANIRRCFTEMIQLFAVWCIANLIEWPDDKKRPWALKLAEYSAKRLTHELGGLAPSLIMPRELLKTVMNPLPSASVLSKSLALIGSAVDPRDWVDETQSGPYKGMSTLEKNFLKAPIPGVAQYKQMDRFLENIDTSIEFYARNTQ